jgi:hypothetical protein
VSEPNPYEPPQRPGPLKPVQIVKRGLGVVTVLLLTPVAVLITGSASCAVSAVTMNLSGNFLPGTVDLTVFIAPPLLVLVAMLWWAVRTYRRQRQLQQLKAHRR